MTSAIRFSASAWLTLIKQVDARAATLIRKRNDMTAPPDVKQRIELRAQSF